MSEGSQVSPPHSDTHSHTQTHTDTEDIQILQTDLGMHTPTCLSCQDMLQAPGVGELYEEEQAWEASAVLALLLSSEKPRCQLASRAWVSAQLKGHLGRHFPQGDSKSVSG